MKRHLVLLLLCMLYGCADEEIAGGAQHIRVIVMSDPPGARIVVDERDTGRLTPDTLRGLIGQHDITPQIDTLGARYGYNARLSIAREDSTLEVRGPLLLRCFEVQCFQALARSYASADLRFSVNPAGMLFHRDSRNGNGLYWPGITNNGYVSIGMPMLAAVMNGRDTVALGIYDAEFLAGRPYPVRLTGADSVAVLQSTWILPPVGLLQRATVRGISIEQRLIAAQRSPETAIIQLVFRNISALPVYRTVDPVMPVTGVLFTNVWIGFAIDPDIGTTNDDMISYAPYQDMVFAYDARFDESSFGGGYNRKPGLIGLRAVAVPANTSVILNGWSSLGAGTADWVAGRLSEPVGWYNLSGSRPYSPSHPSLKIGHLPEAPGDMRMTVSAGPLTLAPGDSAAITVAVLIAEPVAGTFTSGIQVDPGNPLDSNRPLAAIAAQLLDRARSVQPPPRN
jgi:hypothetical protein